MKGGLFPHSRVETSAAVVIDKNEPRKEGGVRHAPNQPVSAQLPAASPRGRPKNRRYRGGDDGEFTMGGMKVRPRRRLLPSDKTRQKLTRGGALVIPAWSPGLGIDVEAEDVGGVSMGRRKKRRQAMPWSANEPDRPAPRQRKCQSSLLNGILRTYCEERNLTDILDDPVEIPPETVMLKYQNNAVRFLFVT